MDLDEATGQNPQPDEPTLWEARFTGTATTDADELKVLIDGFDGGVHDFEVFWTPLPGPTYPTAGDLALVCQSDQGRWWCLAWLPS